jgi:hypothetical protein
MSPGSGARSTVRARDRRTRSDRGVLDLTTFELFEEDGNLERRLAEHIPFQCAANGIETCDLVDYSSPPSNRFASPAGYLVIGSSVAPGDSGSGVYDEAQFASPSVIGVTSAVTFGSDGW